MGFKRNQFFHMACVIVACFYNLKLINASPLPVPARRAFDTSPVDSNNVDPNGVADVQRLPEVDATIKEVEGLLNSDPSLPRLTRGEILDIIDNLTKSDVPKTVIRDGERDPKAIMVVLPYSADSVQNGDFQALYTKPPMTHIIEDGSDDERITQKPEFPQKKRRPTKKPYQSGYENYEGVKIAKVPTTEATTTTIEQEHFQQQQKQRTTTENPFTRFINRGRKTTKLPGNHKQEFYEDQTPTSTTTTTTTTTETPRTTRRRKATRKPTSTTTTTSTTTVKPFEFIPNHGINIIDPPSFQPMPGKPSVVQFQPIPTKPTTTTTTTSTTTPKFVQQRPMMVDEVQIPEDFKEVLKSLDILIKQSPTEPPSTLDDSPVPDQLSDQDKLKLLFASLGGQQTTTTTTTTTTSQPDVMQVANNLTPEMKDLLMTFGLIPDPNKDKTTTPKVEVFMEPSSVISADSYSSFKPLPAGSNTNPNEGMEDFLAKFGLVDSKPLGSSSREQKAISMSKPQNDLKPLLEMKPNLDVIPDKFKDVIADIGFPLKIDSVKPRNPETEENKDTKEEATKKPDHVFNPASAGTEYASQDEINRLNQLMGVIKQFEKLNGTANEDDLKHIDLEGLKVLVNSFNVPLDQQTGPNPLDYDVGLLKNEVKRQTSTTEKPQEPIINPSLALLEDSFGGPSATETATVETITTEAPKKTGFYYLLDWNSFFDIDNQKGKRVNLRFQPKVGDPKRFFSVNVP